MSEQTIRQIIPAEGWRVVTTPDHGETFDEEALMGFALVSVDWDEVERRRKTNDDYTAYEVVPLVLERLFLGGFALPGGGVVADDDYWADRRFVCYLGPGQHITDAGVQKLMGDYGRESNEPSDTSHPHPAIPMPPRTDSGQPG